MKEAYLINLEGMEDTTSALVTKEVFEWIERPDTPGREGKISGWVDTGIPHVLHETLKKDSFYSTPFVTIGSFNNDRAIIMVSADTNPDGSTGVLFSDDDEKTVKEWARENGVEIKDTYVGGLY